MSQASEIIKELDMSDGAIAQAIGFTRVAVLRVRNEQSNGERMLSKLQQLYRVQKGHSHNSTSTLMQVSTTFVAPRQHRPKTHTEVEREERLEHYQELGKLAPTVVKVEEITHGIRGKVVESVLPDNYQVVKKAQEFSHAPTPKPVHKSNTYETSYYGSPLHIAITAIKFLCYIFAPDNPQQKTAPRQLTTQQYPALPAPKGTPTWNPAGVYLGKEPDGTSFSQVPNSIQHIQYAEQSNKIDSVTQWQLLQQQRRKTFYG